VRIVGGENLRNGATAVVADQINLLNSERVHDFGEHARLRGKRNILRRPDLGKAQSHEVDGNAAPPMPHAVNDVAPVIPVEGDAVDKERGWSLPLLEEGNAPGPDVGEAAVCVKGCDVHGASLETNMSSGGHR